MKLLLLAASLISLVATGTESISDRKYFNTCDPNVIEERQYCRCPPGERISEFKSKHSNEEEDRIWTLGCAAIAGDRPFDASAEVHETAYGANWDRPMYWDGSQTNSFMVGMESFHKDRFEDRKYKYFYQNSEDWILSNCHWNVTANDYDEDVNVVLDSDKVIAGAYSEHSNSAEDRIFHLHICTLSPRCSELKEIVYDYDKMKTSSKTTIVGESIKDNLNHSEAGTILSKITKSNQETLAESYSYEKTEGDQKTASVELSNIANWGPEAGKMGQTEITGGFSNTWSTSETWKRSNEKSITEENGYQISFEDTCPGNHYCVSQVMMTTGEADIPYTITSFTKKNPSDECIEFGIMKVKNSWNAKSVVTSSTSKESLIIPPCNSK